MATNPPVVVTSTNAVAGNFKIRASGALAGVGLLGGFLDLRDARRANPNLTFIQGLHVLAGYPPPPSPFDDF